MVNESVTANPFRLAKRVLPQHTDHGGVMWHGGYVAWLEEARIEALSAIGFPYERFVALGLEMPVVRLEIRYREALRLGDEVLLESWPQPRHGVRWPWTTRVVRAGVCAVEARVDLALVKVGRARRVLRHPPEEVAEVFEVLTGRKAAD
ncbi:MAG: acyl-CoA thioesterase [Synechococcus sp.]|jgi:acyl-CoA thioester hydrolase|uniref:acyl-CoA thioesterase n=1 Tax=Synechococcus sp. BMK-MC-1 TaxID=1442551 RepID=UPI0016491454|nr:thioesterase family protein [Synechococcus sp. BMK-MC-1]